MKDNITQFPPPESPVIPEQPKRVLRPCDAGLWSAVNALETQLGTIEAYNRLVDAAAQLREKIESGNSEAQNPFYANVTINWRKEKK